MKKTLLILVAIVITFSSCSSRPTSPQSIIRHLCESEVGLPSGSLYFSDAAEGSAKSLEKELLAVAYGIPIDFDGIESAAIWLSSVRHPCEFAIFLCKDANAAEDISLFCNQRIRSLMQNASLSAPLCNMSTAEYREYISGAFVTVSGRYVALIISSDPDSARRAFIKAL